MRAFWLASIWLLFCAVGVAHEITFSQLDIRIGQQGTQIRAALPVQALIQEEPSSLPAGTTLQMLEENPVLPTVAQAVTTLLADRLSLISNGKALTLTVTGVSPSGTDIVVTAEAPPAIGRLAIEANLFPTDPLHKLFASIYRGEALAGQYALDAGNGSVTLDGLEQPLIEVIGTFILEGIHHIFIGQDHILFVIALILLGGPLWGQLKIITAFTVAHSITLVLATLGVVQLPSQLVESVIAFSIVVVGVHDLRALWSKSRPESRMDLRIAFAFVFGLVHGFGFASVLAELALPQQALAWSLAAFNIGVELGQVAIVMLASPLVWAIHRFASTLVARVAISAMAIMIVVMGSVWLFQRLL